MKYRCVPDPLTDDMVKDGNARAELGMSVNTVTFGSKSEGGGETRKPSGGPDDLDDSVPF